MRTTSIPDTPTAYHHGLLQLEQEKRERLATRVGVGVLIFGLTAAITAALLLRPAEQATLHIGVPQAEK